MAFSVGETIPVLVASGIQCWVRALWKLCLPKHLKKDTKELLKDHRRRIGFAKYENGNLRE
jgi:hypothetical protein